MTEEFFQVRLYCRYPSNYGPHCEVSNHETEASAREHVARAKAKEGEGVRGFVLLRCTRVEVASEGVTDVNAIK